MTIFRLVGPDSSPCDAERPIDNENRTLRGGAYRFRNSRAAELQAIGYDDPMQPHQGIEIAVGKAAHDPGERRPIDCVARAPETEENIMTRLASPWKYNPTNPGFIVDNDPPSRPYEPLAGTGSDAFIPFITDDVPAQTEIRRHLGQPERFQDWPPAAAPIPYIEYGWPPKAPFLEAPPPERPPTRFLGPTPSRIVRDDPAGAADGYAGRPAAIGQNLTVRTLRMKGVPEEDINAAINDPQQMKGLLYRLYGGG